MFYKSMQNIAKAAIYSIMAVFAIIANIKRFVFRTVVHLLVLLLVVLLVSQNKVPNCRP